MNKENLFKLIRQEEVVLFIGAGLSRHAGYPSGNQLAQTIYNNLKSDEKAETSKTDLAKLANDYITLRSRKELINLLYEIFSQIKPTSVKAHETLAKIPHINEIITTNYDSLIEDAYNNDIVKIISSNDLIKYNQRLTNLYKIHGDFSIPDSIIISNEDYNDKFHATDNYNQELWDAIKQLFIKKYIIFIGYNLNDSDILAIFKAVSKKFDENMRDVFFIAPNINNIKQKELAKYKIHYIEDKGENFISELYENIKSNFTSDIDNQITNIDTIKKFAKKYGCEINVENIKGEFKFKSLQKIEGTTLTNFKFDVVGVSSEFIDSYNKFESGYIDKFTFPSEKIQNIDLKTEGIKIPIKKISSISIKKVPNLKTKIDIRFKNGFEKNNVPIKVYRSPNHIKITSTINNFNYSVEFPNTFKPKLDFKFNYKRNEDLYESTKSEIENCDILLNFFSGNEFTIFHKTKNVFKERLHHSNDFTEKIQKHKNYIMDIKKVENFYNIQFKNFKLDFKSNQILKKVLYKIENKEHVFEDTCTLGFKTKQDYHNAIKLLSDKYKEDTSLSTILDEEKVELYGHCINLGQSEIVFYNPIIKETDLLNKSIKCKKGKISIRYFYD